MDGDPVPRCFLSLVIPAFNEADGIVQAVEEADASLAGLDYSYEIIVVDDGSSDATANLVRNAAVSRPCVRVVQHAANRGYGAALRTGFASAQGERVAFTDADCQFHLADLAPLLELTNHVPIAVGYRVDRQDSWLRKFYSRSYNLLARTLLGTRVRDVDCALKVFRKEALTHLLPDTHGFFVNTEMLTRARQYHLHVAEAGVRHRPRLRGRSKVSLTDIPKTLNALVPFWWSQVLFPRQAQAGKPAGAGWMVHVALLALMAALLFYGRLGAPLLEPEEARYAEIPRQMLAEGRLVTPVLHGEAYYHKPPLMYWLVMASYGLFGVHDWAARLVACTAAMLTVLVTYGWAARVVGRSAAFVSAAMLCLGAKFLYQAGMLTLDGPLCLFVTMSLACAHTALTGASLRRGWWWAAGAACGLGVLTKGPVALALVVPPLLAWQFFERRTARLSTWNWLAFVGMATAVAGPWFLAVLLRDPSALAEFFWLHNLVRFVAPFDHEEPLWFYVPSVIAGLFPWSLLLVPLTGYLARRSPSAARRRPMALGFFLLALGWCVLFFSLSGCKRAGYVLPAYPLLALVLGTFLTSVVRPGRVTEWLRARAHPAWSQWAHRTTLAALGLGILVVGAAAARGLWSWPMAVAADLVLLAAMSIVWQRGPSRVAWRAWGACGATVFVLLLVAVHQLLPMYHRAFALRGQVRRHVDLTQGDVNLPVASYPKRWDSISFYLERNDVDAYSPAQRDLLIRDLQKQGQTLLFVRQGDALQDLLEALPNNLEFVPRGRQGRNVASGVVQSRSAER